MTKTTTKPKGKKKKDDSQLTAKRSDRYELYEQSVQEPESECDLIDQVWRELHERQCHHIREDFCGTAAVCMEWVKRRRKNTAVGVDIYEPVLKWAQHRIPKRLNAEQATRLQLITADVLEVHADPVDSVLAMNFSYYLFTTRDTLRRYFERAREGLVEDGILLLDAYGGSDSFLAMEEEREIEGFDYVWDQHSYNPITGEATNYIHFKFPDGSELLKAFEYHWRLWTLPEIRELLLEAGFADVTVYWEGTDEETEEGDGEWSATTEGEACPGWVAYLAARVRA